MKKNQKLIILVGVLLLFGGISFAYFVSKVLSSGNGSVTEGTTANINGAKLTVTGTLTFNDLDILPGHQNVSSIKVTATGDNELIPYNLIWNGTNSLNTSLNYKVYKTSSSIEVTSICEKKTSIENGVQILSEECSINNLDSLGSMISSGTIETSTIETKVELVSDEFITASPTGEEVYYYVILEYPNLNENQNSDIGGEFKGTVTVEESDTQPDINILAAYIEQEDGTYQETSDIPQSGYILNSEKSVCSNGAIPAWDIENNRFYMDNFTKSGTSCYLYFDIYKEPTAGEEILANVTVNTGTPNFSAVATTDKGVYAVADGMYGGTSYYWRGAVTNNYVTFAGYCWRIIRINGDGSIRLIYDGTTCHANGTSTANSIAVTSKAYNSSYNNSAYVGWSYTASSQHGTGTPSNARSQVETWYTNNLASYANYIADGKYCNDRNVGSTSTWSATGSTFYYAACERAYTTYAPTLSCTNTSDVFTVKIGLITVDEVMFAGGSGGTENSSFYLYNGNYYWTMSPYRWDGHPIVFYVTSTGSLTSTNLYYVTSTYGLRPVINLNSDITFSSGNGTQSTPYIVKTT